MQTKYVIVGGGVAGSTAAQSILTNDPQASVTIICDESYGLYARLRLSSLVRGAATKSDLILKSTQHFQDRGIILQLNNAAASLDADEKIVTLVDGQRVPYDKLLIATGSAPRLWRVPGAQLEGVLSMRSLDQAEQAAGHLRVAKHVVVVGGGFITLEYIEALRDIGVSTTVVIRDPFYWANRLDEESGKLIQEFIDKVPNVEVVYGAEVELVEGTEKVEAVVLSNGKRLPADTVLTNIGVEPAIDWLENSGLNIEGGLEVDEYLRTADQSIWAAGDVAFFHDRLLGVRHRIANWDNAASQGQLVGANMSSLTQSPFQNLSSYAIHALGMDVCFIGDTHYHPGIVAVPRGSARSGAYGRLLLHGERLLGATLINRFSDRQAIEDLIRTEKIITQQDLMAITDESVDLRDLVRPQR